MKKQAIKKTIKKTIKDDPEKKHIDEENYADDSSWTEDDKDPEFIEDDGIFTADPEEDEDDDF